MNLLRLQPEDLAAYKLDMQEAFRMGALEGGFPGEEEILPEDHIDRSLNTPGAIAYKAVLGGEMVGGAIIVLEGDRGHLDFLYVKHGFQDKGVGTFIWFEIERHHPEIKVWETCTPCFEKRNIHFYVNVCGFHITEFWNAHHPDPNCPEDVYDGYFEGIFQFQKQVPPPEPVSQEDVRHSDKRKIVC